MAVVFEVGVEYELESARFGTVRGVVLGTDPEFVRVRLTSVQRGASRQYLPGEERGFRLSLIGHARVVGRPKLPEVL